MISGFNTDVEHDGTVYHVQTEDKGLPSREIMSLVYDRGTILASKRVSYGDLSPASVDVKELEERVQRQHKLMCAAVRSGRIEELKGMTAKAARIGTPRPKSSATVEPAGSVAAPPPRPHQSYSLQANTGREPHENAHLPAVVPSQKGETQLIQVVPIEPVIEPIAVIEEEILPADAVAVVSELSDIERPANNKLSLELVGDTKFHGGERKTVIVMLCRGTNRKVVPQAQIMIKVLGSTFRPVIFHSRSDQNGLARVHLQLPHFQAGRAALLVRAIADGEEIELRKLVTPG